MCYNPIKIKNPNFGLDTIASKDGSVRIRPSYQIGLNFLKDTTNQYIEVPCGRCRACVFMKQSYFMQRIMLEAEHKDVYMFTLTYNNESIRRINIGGYEYKYADIQDVQNMIKRIRRKNLLPPFKFVICSEYGSKKHRPHYHGLLILDRDSSKLSDTQKLSLDTQVYKIIQSSWTRNTAKTLNKKGEIVANTRNPIYKACYTHRSCFTRSGEHRVNFDCHRVVPKLRGGKLDVMQDVCAYVTKYIMKADKWIENVRRALKMNYSPEEYREYWTLLRPKILVSKHLAFDLTDEQIAHIKSCIQESIGKYDYPVMKNPLTSGVSPLCPQLKKRFMTVDDALSFYFLRTNGLTTYDNATDNPLSNYEAQLQIQKSNQFQKAKDYVYATHYRGNSSEMLESDPYDRDSVPNSRADMVYSHFSDLDAFCQHIPDGSFDEFNYMYESGPDFDNEFADYDFYADKPDTFAGTAVYCAPVQLTLFD